MTNSLTPLCYNDSVHLCPQPQLSQVTTTEPGVVHFKVDTLQCRVGLNTQHLQSLHIKITTAPEHKDSWSQEELQILEKVVLDNWCRYAVLGAVVLDKVECCLSHPQNVLSNTYFCWMHNLLTNLYCTISSLMFVQFFDMRASAPPYKPNALCCFGRMLSVQFNVLKDFVQIMKLELVIMLENKIVLKS